MTRPKQAGDWNDRYATGDLPWDTGEPDPHLVEMVSALSIQGGPALEIGCGTGTNALWLAQRGFDVLGLDISPTAIEQARAKMSAETPGCRFAAIDFLEEEVAGGPFCFVFDRGCFHVFDQPDQQATYARRVAELLQPEGIWLSLVGCTEGPARDHGPPRRSVRDVASAIEPHLELLELRNIEFRANLPSSARAWLCVSRKRAIPAQPSTLREANG